MRIVVCVKQTPEGDVRVDEKTGCLIREGAPCALNPFDEFAIEEAVRLKERVPGSSVAAVTMGPPQAEAVLREAVARGADAVYHVCGKEFAGSDTWATSYALARAVKKIGADVVVCGKQTNDSDTGHIGPQISAWLGWPNAAFVRKVEEVNNSSMRVERLMEDGYDVLELPLPALISVIKEINVPRIASLKGRLAAKKAVITKLSAADLGCEPDRLGANSPTAVVKCFTPKRVHNSVKIEGADAKQKAAALVKILRERKAI